MEINKQSYWIKSGGYTIIQRFGTAIFGFGSFFFLIRILSKEEFGMWVLFTTTTALLEVSRTALIQNALIRFLASSDKQQHPAIITASFIINIIFTSIVVIVLILFAGEISLLVNSPGLESLFYWYIVTTFSLIIFSTFNFIQQAYLDFKGVFYSDLFRQGLFFVMVTFLFFTEIPFNLESLVLAQAVFIILGSMVSYFFLQNYYRMELKYSKKWVAELFHYGKYVFGTGISSAIFRSIDQLMLSFLLSPVAVALYNPAIKVANIVEVPTLSLSKIMFPKLAQFAKKDGPAAAKHMYEKSTGLILAFMLPIVIITISFSELIILLIAGEQYLESASILSITILYVTLIPFAVQFGTVLDAIGKPKINFYFVLLNMVMNISLNFVFINAFGVIGAAYATLLTFVIFLFLSQIVLSKVLDVKFINTFMHLIAFYKNGFFFVRKYISGSKK